MALGGGQKSPRSRAAGSVVGLPRGGREGRGGFHPGFGGARLSQGSRHGGGVQGENQEFFYSSLFSVYAQVSLPLGLGRLLLRQPTGRPYQSVLVQSVPFPLLVMERIAIVVSVVFCDLMLSFATGCLLRRVPFFCQRPYPSSICGVYERDAQVMGEGWRHNENAKHLLEVALCTSGKLGVVAYPGKPPTVIDEGFGHFVATVNPLVSCAGVVSLSSLLSLSAS